MIELKYEKEINDSLRSLIVNKDKIIALHKDNEQVYIKKLQKHKSSNTWTTIISSTLIGVLLTLLIVK